MNDSGGGGGSLDWTSWSTIGLIILHLENILTKSEYSAKEEYWALEHGFQRKLMDGL